MLNRNHYFHHHHSPGTRVRQIILTEHRCRYSGQDGGHVEAFASIFDTLLCGLIGSGIDYPFRNDDGINFFVLISILMLCNYVVRC